MIQDEMKEKILQAAIECIEEEGFQNITVRKIAQKAEVNIAAINYYFRSKEKLIEELMEVTLEEGLINSINEHKELWDTDPLQATKNFLGELFEEIFNYQAISKAHFFESFVNGNYDTVFNHRFNSFIERFYSLVESLLPQYSTQDKKIVLMQIISAVTLPGILPKLFSKDFVGTDFDDELFRKRYLQILIQTYLSPNIDNKKSDPKEEK